MRPTVHRCARHPPISGAAASLRAVDQDFVFFPTLHLLGKGSYDLPRVAYGVCVGSVIRGARRGRRLPTMDNNICTRKRCPR